MKISLAKKDQIQIANKQETVNVTVNEDGSIAIKNERMEVTRPGEYGFNTFSFIAIEVAKENFAGKINLINYITELGIGILILNSNLELDKEDINKLATVNIIIANGNALKFAREMVKKYKPEVFIYMDTVDADEKELAAIKEIVNFDAREKTLKFAETDFNSEEDSLSVGYTLVV